MSQLYVKNKKNNNLKVSVKARDYGVKSEERLSRFLIMGASGDYYAGQKQRTAESEMAVSSMLARNGVKAVEMAHRVSAAIPVRAVTNDPAVYVVSRALREADTATREKALSVYNEIVRTGSDFLHSAITMSQSSTGGWRFSKRAMAGWLYQEHAYFQAAKYFNRDGMNMRDALRLAHATPRNQSEDVLFQWIASGLRIGNNQSLIEKIDSYEIKQEVKDFMLAVEFIRNADAESAVKLIQKYKLPWEVVPAGLKKDPYVSKAMFDNLPPHALLRSLAEYSARGTINGRNISGVTEKLLNIESMRNNRVHPFKVLVALMSYQRGRNDFNKTWAVYPQIVDALESLFHESFDAYIPHGKKVLIAVDDSASMGSPSLSPIISSSQAAVAFALTMAAREKNATIVTFSDRVRETAIPKRSSIIDAASKVCKMMSYTDCAAPIDWAFRNGMNFDAIVMLTDSVQNGVSTAAEALSTYREKVNPNTKFFVAQFANNNSKITNPDDLQSMTYSGFDTEILGVSKEFITGWDS